MSLIAVPSSPPQHKKWALRVGAPIAGIALVALAVWISRSFSGSGGAPIGQFYSVVPMDLDIKINKDGELAAVNNIDIVCEVEGQTSITTIVKEGATVKKGDVLCTLDSSAIKQKIEDTTLDLQKAEADLTTSQELKEIQESQNAANLEAAEVALTLAKLDLQAYTEGVYPQDLQNAQTALEMADITLKNKQEDLAQTKQLKDKGFVTASDVKKSELDVTTATNDLAKAKSALKVLTEYQHPKDLADKKNTVSQAEQKLVRTQRENAANLSQKNADVQAKQQNFSVLKRRMEHWQEQLADCTITAPADGMVVYASSGDRWSQVQIQEGATVRERQTLLRLPDTSSMKAVARINESQVGKLAEGMRARVRIPSIPQPIGATVTKISVLADSNSRWVNPDLKEYPVDLVLDDTPKSLKPGMSSQVEILVNHLNDVLAVPLGAVYAAGSDVYVFTRNGKSVKPLKVKVGQANDQYVQVRDGLEAGADVLLLGAGQGRDLLEQNGIKITPTTRGADDGFGPRRGGGRNGGQRGGGDGAAHTNGDGANRNNPDGGAAAPGMGGPGAPGGPQGNPQAAPGASPNPQADAQRANPNDANPDNPNRNRRSRRGGDGPSTMPTSP
jgi:HlyD family secretion protein